MSEIRNNVDHHKVNQEKLCLTTIPKGNCPAIRFDVILCKENHSPSTTLLKVVQSWTGQPRNMDLWTKNKKRHQQEKISSQQFNDLLVAGQIYPRESRLTCLKSTNNKVH